MHTESTQQAQIKAFHGDAKANDHAPSHGFWVEPETLPQTHLVLLVGSGFGIADDDAVRSCRSYMVLLWEVDGFRVGLELIGIRVRPLEDGHGR